MSKVIDKLELAIEVNKLLEDMYPDVYCGVTTAKNDAYLVLRDKKVETRFPQTDDMDDILLLAKELKSDGFTKVNLCSDLVGTTVYYDKDIDFVIKNVIVDECSTKVMSTKDVEYPIDMIWTKD